MMQRALRAMLEGGEGEGADQGTRERAPGKPYLLIPPLHGALALGKSSHVAVRISEHLPLGVPGDLLLRGNEGRGAP